jgi:hypothetical protein
MKPLNTYHVSCEGQIQVVKAHTFSFREDRVELIIDKGTEEETIAYFTNVSWIIKQPEGTEP